MLGWTLAVVAAAVTAGSLLRVALADGLGRYEAAAEGTMAAGMAVMSAPPTAGVYGEQGMWWAAVFAAFGLGGIAVCVHHWVRGGWRHLRHGAHHVIGSAAMVLMTLAMPGAMPGTSFGPALALAGSSAHGMANMGSMHGGAAVGSIHDMPGMEGMDDYAMSAVTGSTGAAIAWRGAFGLLALYFLVSMVLAVRARLRGAGRPVPSAGGKGPRHRRPRRSRMGLSAPNAALAGHIGMGGSMATMLLMMAA
ncbi:DUF5134 domain-containing protein [Streptomyces marianii]|nr:DUF5134 domain-containing protein [Streptomyces marianii]